MQQLPSLQLNVDTLPNLTVAEKEIALACQGEKIKDIDIRAITLFMIGLIGKTFLNTGGDFDKNKEMIDSTVDELAADLKKYNGTLTLPEIEIAFKNGWKKEYGEYFGLNNATYFGWVNAYTWNEKRLRAKKAIENAKESNKVAQPKLSEEEKEEILKKGALKMFADFKAGGSILDAGNITYNFLEAKGLINFSKERKVEILERTKEQMKADAISQKNRTESIDSVLKKVMVDEIIKANAKRNALTLFFSELIEMEAELEF